MPLLISPIDGSPMRQINRYGIEFDVCPTSGGMWLDKGELEKLMALLKEEFANDTHPTSYNGGRKYGRDDDYDDDDYDDDRYRGRRHEGHPYKKKGKMSKIMDIFDF